MRFFTLTLAFVVLLSSARALITLDVPSSCTRVDSHGRVLCEFGVKFLNQQLTDRDLQPVPVSHMISTEDIGQDSVATLQAHHFDNTHALYQIESCSVSGFQDGSESFLAIYECKSTLNPNQKLSFSFSMEFDYEATSGATAYDTKPTAYHKFGISWSDYFLSRAKPALFGRDIDSFCSDVFGSCMTPVSSCKSTNQGRLFIDLDGVVRTNVNTVTCRMNHFYSNLGHDKSKACEFDLQCSS